MRRALYARCGEIGLTKPEIRELAQHVMGCSVATASLASLRVMLNHVNGFVVVSELLALRPSTQAVLEAQRRRLLGSG